MLVLASGSPRRKELLETMGLRDFTILKPDFDEASVPLCPPKQLVKTLSRGKAAAAAEQLCDPQALILAADTVVALDGRVLGKPSSPEMARRMLRDLSGRTHLVYTGFTLRRGNRVLTSWEVTEVTFRSLTPGEIDAYIATGEPMDKAGAYGIQGLGSLLVEGIHGDYFNVVGLPVCRLGRMLSLFGVDCLTGAGRELP